MKGDDCMLKIGNKVMAINEEREDLFGLEGVIVRIAVAVDTFYIVEFEGGHYYYFTEDELEVIND
mgnify:CR=1 FL=1